MKSRNDPAMQRYREEYHRCCGDLVCQLRTEKGWSLEDFSKMLREKCRTLSCIKTVGTTKVFASNDESSSGSRLLQLPLSIPAFLGAMKRGLCKV
jgi:hypothetical protein